MSPPHHKYRPAKAIEFYNKNTVIFLTGATGSVGKSILEKLFRSFPQITKIYLLIRVSEGNTMKDRIEEVVDSGVFDILKAQFSSAQEFQEKIVSKIVPLKGNISVCHLELTDKDIAMVREDTTVFLDCAGSVRLDDSLNTALEANTKGPLQIIEIAKGCRNLAAAVHISSCSVNAPIVGPHNEETNYPMVFDNDLESIFEMLSTKMSDEEIRDYEKSVVLKSYPSTYIFAKCLVEALIIKRYKDMALPIVIVHSSIVSAACQVPVPGWVEGHVGANRTAESDLIPVDIVTKTTLLSATTADGTLAGPPIYHIGIKCINPTNWRTFGMYVTACWRAVKRPCRRVSSDIRFELCPGAEFKRRFDVHFGDQLQTLVQHEGDRKLKARISWVKTLPIALKSIFTFQWHYDVNNTLALDDAAPVELKSHLRRGIDWHKYMEDYNAGVQTFILGEKVDRSIVIEYPAALRSELGIGREEDPESTAKKNAPRL
ncbi:cyclin-dependent kinase inhibitor far1 [Lobosporangium transversale]|uniref:Fatty acyl-CoA reductase n=1 Tax=Lobosporangium transversale TaxID=64571 RepID=A0A1Y2GQT5_9FUNG|nr:male sterility protein-domain-containing protein [Lobosporangium transversale]KAF9911478.1 cyclin-dependent kinase inhibitor far1 [Lobosporangium transversale]ORZ18206.1 male sterility protein-domain-containing protein [Lobosporangium transversale]|eukprot:XP_021882001.1 male sterility protein-domain-containing protein [Lobosporangium transversale]